jgi:hypothetical protein
VAPVNGLPPETLIRCRSFKAALPDEVGDSLARRGAQPASDTTAAFGDEPPITLRCGVAEGSERDDPYTFNGVQWALHDTGASRTWTTVGRKANVAVQVPDRYDAQAELVGAISLAVAKALPQR